MNIYDPQFSAFLPFFCSTSVPLLSFSPFLSSFFPLPSSSAAATRIPSAFQHFYRSVFSLSKIPLHSKPATMKNAGSCCNFHITLNRFQLPFHSISYQFLCLCTDLFYFLLTEERVMPPSTILPLHYIVCRFWGRNVAENSGNVMVKIIIRTIIMILMDLFILWIVNYKIIVIEYSGVSRAEIAIYLKPFNVSCR